MPSVVVKLVDYLKKQQQVCKKLINPHNKTCVSVQVQIYLRQLTKPVDGVGNNPLALRGCVTTLADATDFIHDLKLMDIRAIRKPSIK